jgi:hypothetical protein
MVRPPMCVSTMVPTSRLGGIVVSVLATGPKGCGFKPGQVDGFFQSDKNPQHTFLSDGKVPCRKILWHVKELLKSHRDEQTKFSFTRPSPTSPQVSGSEVRS